MTIPTTKPNGTNIQRITLSLFFVVGIILFLTTPVHAVGEGFLTFCDPTTESTNASDYYVYEGFEGTGIPSGWTNLGTGQNYDYTTNVFGGTEAFAGTSASTLAYGPYVNTGIVTYSA